jgi:hypothetical protein
MAFDAVQELWRRRQTEGLTQRDIADRLGRNPGWVSRQLKGPGNWTFRTFGAFVEALDGEAEISVHPLEQPLRIPSNFDAYAAKVGPDFASHNQVSPDGERHRLVVIQAPIPQDLAVGVAA